jgi:hypothetical protein
VKLLTVISHRGRRGMKRKELFAAYNDKTIVQRRIDRFIAVGQIKKSGAVYVLVPSMSAFSLRAIFSGIFGTLFPL